MGTHDRTPEDDQALDRVLGALGKQCVDIESILMPNALLLKHPLHQPDFITKGKRIVPWGTSADEFRDAFQELQRDRPEEEWSYPPNLEGYNTPEFWGLPSGAIARVSIVWCMLSARDALQGSCESSHETPRPPKGSICRCSRASLVWC